MNPRAADVTEVRQDKQSRAAYKTVVTPVLKKFAVPTIPCKDVSATRKHECIFGLKDEYERTPLHAEYELLITDSEFLLNEEDAETLNPNNDVNEHRITLLARKYANKHMLPEDTARLDILTQKLRNTMPSITEGDFEIMESLIKKIDSVTKLNERLQERYK